MKRGRGPEKKFETSFPFSRRYRRAASVREIDQSMGNANMLYALGDLDGAMAAVHSIITQARE